MIEFEIKKIFIKTNIYNQAQTKNIKARNILWKERFQSGKVSLPLITRDFPEMKYSILLYIKII